MPFAGRIDSVVSEGTRVLRLEDLKPGTPVKKGDVVARIVPRDIQLSVERADAEVRRLEAAIAENEDVGVERTVKEQALQLIKSMTATVEAARERLRSGKSKLDYAKWDFERVRKLAATGARTQDELEQAQVRKVQAEVDYRQDRLVHAAMAAMAVATDLMPTMVQKYIERKLVMTNKVLSAQQAEAEVRRQQVLEDKQRGTMRSPVDGVILKRSITNERLLTAGATLMEIGRPEDLEIEADVLSLDVVDAKKGDPVAIYGPAVGRPADRSIPGTVDRIYPAGFTKISSLGVEQQRVKVIIRFDPDVLGRLLAKRDLGVGYRVRVRIFTAEKPQALVAPRNALFRATDGNWRVYAIRGGRAYIQKVEVGLINDERAEITKGLSEGDQVVLAPESNLSNGARVEIKQQGS